MRKSQLVKLLLSAAASLAAVPASSAQTSYHPPDNYTRDPLGVDIGSGIYERHDTLLTIGDLGNGGLAWTFYGHDGKDPFAGYVSYWVSPAVSDNQYQVQIGATIATFMNCQSGTCQNGSGTGATLALSGSNWLYTDQDGTLYTFSVTDSYTSATTINPIVTLGTLLSIKRPNGDLYTINYSGNHIQSVVSNRGYAFKYDWAGYGYGYNGYGQISGVNLANHVCTSTVSSCDAYDNYLVLSTSTGGWTMTDQTGAVWTYGLNDIPSPGDYRNPAGGWTTRDGITYFKSPGGYEATINYDRDGRVTSFVDNRGTFPYTYPDQTLHLADLGNTTHTISVNDPSSNLYFTAHSSGMQADWFKDALGKQRSFAFSGGYYGVHGTIKYSRPGTITQPESNSRTWSYDSRGNNNLVTDAAKTGSGLTSTTITPAYPSSCTNQTTCNKPTSLTDANGNVTSYTYDSTSGQVLTETAPAVQVDGTGTAISPVKRYAYTLRKAWYKNASGTLVQSSDGIYLLTSEKTCRKTTTNVSTDSCAGGSNDEVVTTYDYGPDTGTVGNNLLLRGKVVTAQDTDGTIKSLRTCYGYDGLGNKIWETAPRAGLSACY